MSRPGQGDVLVAPVEWPRGAAAGAVAADYIRSIGLRPEDCYGIVPAHRGAGELLFIYDDAPQYAAGRERPLPPTARASRWLPGVVVQGPGVPLDDRAHAEPMAFVAEQLTAAGVTLPGLDAAPATTPPPAVPGALEGSGPVHVHALQWPGVRRVEGFGSPAEAFSFYSAVVGLRPEDCFGWVADDWDPHGDVSHWESFSIVYRDRPAYAAGRARLAALAGRHEAGESLRFAGAEDDVPSLAGPPVTVQVTGTRWPRRRLLRLRGTDLAAHLATLVQASGTSPAACFGLGVDRHSDALWLAVGA